MVRGLATKSCVAVPEVMVRSHCLEVRSKVVLADETTFGVLYFVSQKDTKQLRRHIGVG
jgi:hypothetical protein